MANEALARSLERLQQQLSQGPELDESTSTSLQALLSEIQSVCARAEVSPAGAVPSEESPQHSLGDRLQRVIEDFESRHPQLTVTLSQIADQLSDLGI
jgi:hypothetical protein